MNLSIKPQKAVSGIAANHARRIPLLQGAAAFLAALFALVLAVPAQAACGNISGLALPVLKGSVQLPSDGGPRLHSNVMLPFGASNSPIVGLWHVIYTASDGSPFNNTFDTWHSDGTEFESAFLPVVAGNLCVGVWKQTGARTVKLYHVGWLFGFPGLAAPDPNDPAKFYFVLQETVTVSPDGQSYNGSFTFKVYNVSDNSYTGTEVDGTMTAARINVN